MPPRKRQNVDAAEPVAKRRSSRQAAVTAAQPVAGLLKDTKTGAKSPAKRDTKNDSPASGTFAKTVKPTPKRATAVPTSKSKAVKDSDSAETSVTKPRATSEDPEIDFIPTVNSEAPRHDGEWYWLMKAEPESRFENGIDVRFSIDDLRAKEKPEGWDGESIMCMELYSLVSHCFLPPQASEHMLVRFLWEVGASLVILIQTARNHMRNMNAGDKAFFYHSNCKEPAIAGIMEIVKEFSEDSKPRWHLHNLLVPH